MPKEAFCMHPPRLVAREDDELDDFDYDDEHVELESEIGEYRSEDEDEETYGRGRQYSARTRFCGSPKPGGVREWLGRYFGSRFSCAARRSGQKGPASKEACQESSREGDRESRYKNGGHKEAAVKKAAAKAPAKKTPATKTTAKKVIVKKKQPKRRRLRQQRKKFRPRRRRQESAAKNSCQEGLPRKRPRRSGAKKAPPKKGRLPKRL